MSLKVRGLIQERRVNMSFRQKVNEMTREELIRALLTDDMTGLPNLRAYVEGEKKPIQVICDLDGLKWVNDTFGYEAGDDMIRTAADCFRRFNVETYRSNASGDEFICQFDSWMEASCCMALVQMSMRKAMFCIDTVIRGRALKGIGLSYGISTTLQTAESLLKVHKERRTREGKRAADRSQKPPILQEVEL